MTITSRILFFVAAILTALSALALVADEALYRSIAGADLSDSGRDAIDLLAGKGLLLLLPITGVVVLIAWRTGRRRFILLGSAGVGTIVAYACSEAIKLLVTEERPCRSIDIDTIAACPAAGDWSWPSNHATIAFALATACILVLPRIWLLVVPIAALIAVARVGAGVHYLHDVLAGAALGIAVTAAIGLFVNAMLQRLIPPSQDLPEVMRTA